MSRRVVVDLADLAAWQARTPGGTASTQVAIEPGAVSRLGGGTATVRGTVDAAGHRIERALAAIDLAAFDDLELWVRGDRPADGSEARPFFLELRLGSGELPIGDAANTWHRHIPVAVAGAWQPVPLALDDLAPAVRGSVTQIRFTCVDATTPFALHLDAIAAVRAELLLDVDAALTQRLGGRLQIDGAAVAAIVDPAPAPDMPFLRIRNYAIRPAEERSPSGGVRTDHAGQGFSIRPAALPVDIFYAIEPVADDRADAAALLQFAFAQFSPRSTLDVAGRPLTVEWVEGPPLELDDVTSQPRLHIRVGTSHRPQAARVAAVPPFNRVDLEVDSASA